MDIGWIERVLVAGAGTMGHSLSIVFAQAGYEVDLVDVKEEALEKAFSLIRSNLETLKATKMVRSGSVRKILDRIHPSTSLDVGKRADVVVEAISEDPKAKRKLFHSLFSLCSPRTIFSSNTSYLNIFQFLKTGPLERVLIAHWYAPPHLIPLVDLVKGPKTSEKTLETFGRLLCSVGKKPVVMKRFIPGYIVNRLQRAMGREIFHLIDGGYASPEDIDLAVKSSLGIRIPVVGVVQRYDYTGLDHSLRVERNPSIHLVSKDKISRTLKNLVKRGCLGVKSGKGFYDYSSKTTAEALRERDIKLIEIIRFMEKGKRDAP
jgi:3-hydroxybutyryl-CoA dehydrogenase